MLLLLVAADLGRLFFTYIQLNDAAREGAAYAAANPSTDNATLATVAGREANVQSQGGENVLTATAACTDGFGTTISCASAGGGSGTGNRVTVRVAETFTFFTPLVGNFWPGGLHLGTSATAAVLDFAANPGGPPPADCTTPPPTPDFTWQSPDPVNHPNLVSVDASSSVNPPSPCQIVGYNWDFGGASTDPGSDYLREGITQDYEYAAGGSYFVKLTVQNAAGEASITKPITVGTTTCNAPVASFTISPEAIPNRTNPTNWTYYKNNGHPGTSFTFDGGASAFMSDPACHPKWSWNLGDGTLPAPATSAINGHTYHLSAPGTVNVTLTVTNDAGTNSTTVGLPLVQDK